MSFKETADSLELLNEISDELGALVTALECARVSNAPLLTYFELDPEEKDTAAPIQFSYTNARFNNMVVNDYIFSALDKAKELGKKVNQICNEVRADA